MKQNFVLTLFSVISLLLAFSCGNGSKTDDDYINFVKDGVLKFDESLTIGQSLDNYEYLKNKKWVFFKSDQGRKIVEFSGDIVISAYDEKNTSHARAISSKKINDVKNKISSFIYKVQFELHANDESFDLGYSGYELNYRDGEKENVQEEPNVTLSKIYNK